MTPFAKLKQGTRVTVTVLQTVVQDAETGDLYPLNSAMMVLLTIVAALLLDA